MIFLVSKIVNDSHVFIICYLLHVISVDICTIVLQIYNIYSISW